jgi:hypothetical protein
MDVYEALYTTRMMRRMKADPVPMESQLPDPRCRHPRTERLQCAAVALPGRRPPRAQGEARGALQGKSRARIRGYRGEPAWRRVPRGWRASGGIPAAYQERRRPLRRAFRRDPDAPLRLRRGRSRRRERLPGYLERTARGTSRGHRRGHYHCAPVRREGRLRPARRAARGRLAHDRDDRVRISARTLGRCGK